MDSKVFFIQKQKETLGNILIRILCFLFLISGSAGAFALQPDIVKEVRGVVLDVNNEPLIGVSVMLKGTTIGTITDFDGNYTIKVKGTKPVLSFSYIGYQTQEILVGSKSRIDVVLTEELTALDEVVVVAYGSQSKVTVTGSISSIKTNDLKQTPAPNLVSALTGKLPGLTTIQSSGMPGEENFQMYLRGVSTTNTQNPLILIDGVPRDNIMSIDPNEVESISVLKDASATAVFGVRGANGVILVTTKQGSSEKPSLSISAEFGMQMPTREIHQVDSWDHAILRNQALKNDGLAPQYSDRQIQLYRDGTSPVYPNTDWWDETMKSYAPQNRYNVNLSGGTDKVKYFVNMGMLTQRSLFKTESEKKLGYDPELKLDRYNIRTNLDIKINNWIKAKLNLATYIDKQNKPGVFMEPAHRGSTELIYASIYQHNNTVPGPLTTEEMAEEYGIQAGVPIISPDVDNGNTPYTTINGRGFLNMDKSNLNSSLALDFDLGWLTKGLSSKLQIAFDTYGYSQRDGNTDINSYRFNISEDYDAVTGEFLRDNVSFTEQSPFQYRNMSLSKSSGYLYKMNLQWIINYSRMFGDKHNISGMFLMQRDNSEALGGSSDQLLPYNMVGFSGRFSYRYDERYMFEFDAGYNGSEQFSPDNRFGFFPAASLGWIISNEKFMKPVSAISNFKLRASYGKVGNDQLGGLRFLYLDNYEIVGGGFSGSLGAGQLINQTMVANPNISWEVAYKQNYGIDAAFLDNSLRLVFDYYIENREDVLITSNTRPGMLGLPLSVVPKLNQGKINNSGLEVELSYDKQLNKHWHVYAKGTFNYNRNEVIDLDEVPLVDTERPYAYPYRVEGFSIGQPFGLLIDWDSKGHGYFTSEEEIKNCGLIYEGVQPRPGDFVYKDVNKDGIIDRRDEVPIGYGQVPRINYSAMFSVSYKGFDFSCMFQGVAQTNGVYQDWGVYENQTKSGMYFPIHKNAWTEERYKANETVSYPALSTTASASLRANEFFIMDRSYLRLKNIELGYTLPQEWVKRLRMQNVRLYVNGQNLYTWDNLPFDHFDPEQTSPTVIGINKVVNLGLNVIF